MGMDMVTTRVWVRLGAGTTRKKPDGTPIEMAAEGMWKVCLGMGMGMGVSYLMARTDWACNSAADEEPANTAIADVDGLALFPLQIEP